MIKIINFASGFIIGALIVFGIFFSQKTTEPQPVQQENVSLSAPKELPKNEIEFIEVKVPQNLKEVIL